MRKKHIIHNPQFKAKVARQAIEGRETVSERDSGKVSKDSPSCIAIVSLANTEEV